MLIKPEAVDAVWDLSYKDIVKEMTYGQVGSDHYELRRAVLDAKVAMASEDMARTNRLLAKAAFISIVANSVFVLLAAVVS